MSIDKQIAEMANDYYEIMLKASKSFGTMSQGVSKFYARHLYEKGYRKQSEGEWIDQYQGQYANQLYKCSVCGETAFHDDKRWFLTNFCPNCGAKMKGGAE